MEAFYRLATYDYQLLAEQLDWKALLEDLSNGETLRLLDVACGSGKFPRALLAHTDLTQSKDLRVAYSLLDPSEFSIQEARGQLNSPFEPDREYPWKIQELDCPAGFYRVLWATHALYCVPAEEIPSALQRCLDALAPDGLGFIAQATAEAHYVKFHDLYLQSFGQNQGAAYSTGEQILTSLRSLAADLPLVTWTISYEGQVPTSDRPTVEKYLQRCLFDDKLSLDDMLADSLLGDYLQQRLDESQGQWRFPQTVQLIFFGRAAEKLNSWRRETAGGSPL